MENSYLCPLCLQSFPISDIEALTIEHVPPVSVGGKPILAICRECNSHTGADIDAYLQNELQIDYDSKHFCEKAAKSKISFNGIEINGQTTFDAPKKFLFSVSSHNNDPVKFENFMRELHNASTGYELKFSTNIGKLKRDSRRANISLLKSGYFMAFSYLGYPFILNANLNIVREQILNPTKDILQNVFFAGSNQDIPDEQSCGVFCASFNGIKCILVIMSLRLSKSELSYKGAVALPHPEDINGTLYSTLLKSIGSPKHVEIIGEQCPFPIKPVPINESIFNIIGINRLLQNRRDGF